MFSFVFELLKEYGYAAFAYFSLRGNFCSWIILMPVLAKAEYTMYLKVLTVVFSM